MLNVKHRSVVSIVCLSIHMNYRISGGCNVIRLVYSGCWLWLFSCQAVTSFCCSLRLSLYLNFISVVCAPCPRLQFSVKRSAGWMRVIKGIHAEENEQSFHQCVKGWKCDRINTKTTGNLKYLYLQFLLMSLYHFDSLLFSKKMKNPYEIWIKISMESAEHFIGDLIEWWSSIWKFNRNGNTLTQLRHLNLHNTHDGRWTMQYFYMNLRIK